MSGDKSFLRMIFYSSELEPVPESDFSAARRAFMLEVNALVLGKWRRLFGVVPI